MVYNNYRFSPSFVSGVFWFIVGKTRIIMCTFLFFVIKHPPLTTHDKNDDYDTSGEYNDDEIWCLLVPAFHTGDKANVPTYLPRHCFPGSNTVEHFIFLYVEFKKFNSKYYFDKCAHF